MGDDSMICNGFIRIIHFDNPVQAHAWDFEEAEPAVLFNF